MASESQSHRSVHVQRGHSDVSLTVRVYGSHFPARVPGAVDAVAAAFTGSLPGHHLDTRAGQEAAVVR
jgi:hypothetical protein